MDRRRGGPSWNGGRQRKVGTIQRPNLGPLLQQHEDEGIVRADTPFYELFPYAQRGRSADKNWNPVLIPWYVRVTPKAFPLEVHSPNIYALRCPRNLDLPPKTTDTVEMDVVIKTPKDMIVTVFQPQDKDHRLVVMPATITCHDEGVVKLQIVNQSINIKEVRRGMKIALFTFVRVADNVIIHEEIRPNIRSEYQTSWNERIFSERRAVAALREENRQLGTPMSEVMLWPPRKQNHHHPEPPVSPGYHSQESSETPTTVTGTASSEWTYERAQFPSNNKNGWHPFGGL